MFGWLISSWFVFYLKTGATFWTPLKWKRVVQAALISWSLVPTGNSLISNDILVIRDSVQNNLKKCKIDCILGNLLLSEESLVRLMVLSFFFNLGKSII